MISFSPAGIKQNSMADQRRLQISELHFDKFPTPSTFSCWKIRFKSLISSCSDFPSEGNVMDQGSGDGCGSVDDFVIIAKKSR